MHNVKGFVIQLQENRKVQTKNTKICLFQNSFKFAGFPFNFNLVVAASETSKKRGVS